MAVTPFHAIRVAKNFLLYASFTALSAMEQELLHCGNKEFRVFLAQNSEKYQFFFVRTTK